jgi:hypothetical protein
LVTLGAISFSTCAFVVLGYFVTGCAAGIKAAVPIKVTACTGNLEMLALVLIPVLGMSIPALSYHLPSAAGVVAIGAIAVAPFLMPRGMAVGAEVVQSLKVGILVTMEASCLAMLARQLDRVDAQVHVRPNLGGGVTVVAGQRHGHIVRSEVAGVTVGHLDFQLPLLVAIQADGHGAEHFTRNRVEAVTDAPVAVAAVDITGFARLDPTDDLAVWQAQAVVRKLVR